MQKSGFGGSLNPLSNFLQYGNVGLRDRLRDAEGNLRRTDAFGKPAAQARVDAVKQEIAAVQNEIARKVFIREYTYSSSNDKTFGNEGSFTMRIQTGFSDRNPKVRPSFPLPNVGVDGVNSRRSAGQQQIEFSVRGSVSSITELFRNNDSYRVRMTFTNLRYRGSMNNEADVQSIEIIKVR